MLKTHGFAVSNDSLMSFRYEIRLYELRDTEHEGLAWERRHIEKITQPASSLQHNESHPKLHENTPKAPFNQLLHCSCLW